MRIRIAAGAARGLAHIHHANRSSPRLAHGNVKTTNILLDKNYEPRLADYGLALLGPSVGVATRSAGYRPPEAPPADSRRPWATQKGDVYSFGVVLLEILTGRCQMIFHMVVSVFEIIFILEILSVKISNSKLTLFTSLFWILKQTQGVPCYSLFDEPEK